MSKKDEIRTDKESTQTQEDGMGIQDDMQLDDLFEMLPEGTRIIIRGKTVTFENMTPELLDVALSLNPNDTELKARQKEAHHQQDE